MSGEAIDKHSMDGAYSKHEMILKFAFESAITVSLCARSVAVRVYADLC